MNEIKLQDYIHYYIGCKCVNSWFTGDHDAYNADWILEGYCPNRAKPYLLGNDDSETWTDSIKPILRNILDINQDELKEMIITLSLFDLSNCEFEYDQYWVNAIKNGVVIDCLNLEKNGQIEMMKTTQATNPQPEAFHFLLKRGFDLFGLIESELAIDASTLTK